MSRFADHDMSFLRTLLNEVSDTEIRPRFRALPEGGIAEKKSSIDLVTEADIRSEAYITQALRARFPDALVVGEEASETNPGLISDLKGADIAFVIDPVDGTFNFQAGLPVFGINLAVVSKGETVAGLIHDPLLGDTLMAVRGGGAWLVRADGQEIACKVRPPAALSDMIGTISINDIAHGDRRRIAANLAATKMAFAYNCSAYEYWLVATGKVHFIGHYKLMPWDHLAGVLIHAEAGGFTAKFDGSPYLPGDTSGGIISASDRAVWETVLNDIILA